MKAPKPIKECNTLPVWIVSLGHPKVVGSTVSYLRTVTKDFFLLQFLRKFKFIKIPIVHVDNPLDQKVPFNPRCIGDYLGFVQYWICPLAHLIRTLGPARHRGGAEGRFGADPRGALRRHHRDRHLPHRRQRPALRPGQIHLRAGPSTTKNTR